MNIKDIYEKYKNGDPISDIELKFGINEFKHLEEQLKELGIVFHLAWKEVFYVLKGLEDYKKARKL